MEDVSKTTVVILLVFAILISMIATWSIVNAISDSKSNGLSSLAVYDIGETKQSAITSLTVQGSEGENEE